MKNSGWDRSALLKRAVWIRKHAREGCANIQKLHLSQDMRTVRNFMRYDTLQALYFETLALTNR